MNFQVNYASENPSVHLERNSHEELQLICTHSHDRIDDLVDIIDTLSIEKLTKLKAEFEVCAKAIEDSNMKNKDIQVEIKIDLNFAKKLDKIIERKLFERTNHSDYLRMLSDIMH